jgi:hypothetical protein
MPSPAKRKRAQRGTEWPISAIGCSRRQLIRLPRGRFSLIYDSPGPERQAMLEAEHSLMHSKHGGEELWAIIRVIEPGEH